MLDEKQLVNTLEKMLMTQLRFQTYNELQITNKYIDISKIVKNDQERIRIDLCRISEIDSSIHFFEAEKQLHIQHPTIYRHFCDYCYLVCPEEQFYLLDKTTQNEQLTWAEEDGIGIITISKEGKIGLRVNAIKQNLQPVVRKEVLRSMNNRSKIRFSTIPLWERR